MTRSLAATALTLLGLACAPPRPEEPAPARLQIDALLPTPSLDAVRADCIAAGIANVANAGGLRASKDRHAKVQPDPLAGAPGVLAQNLFSWSPSPSERVAAAREAVGRIRADWYVAADYSELADMHARAFRLAARMPVSDRLRRQAEEVLRQMAWSQPDLEALYQQAFEARYHSEESCRR